MLHPVKLSKYLYLSLIAINSTEVVHLGALYGNGINKMLLSPYGQRFPRWCCHIQWVPNIEPQNEPQGSRSYISLSFPLRSVDSIFHGRDATHYIMYVSPQTSRWYSKVKVMGVTAERKVVCAEILQQIVSFALRPCISDWTWDVSERSKTWK